MVPFSGWIMPVQYTGIIEEHLHTRSKAGLFDICHMGEFFIRGSSAEKEVDRLVTCRIQGLADGKCRYGFLLRDDGGILDDLIVFKISRTEYMLVVNSGTMEKDKKWIQEHIAPGVEFSDGSSNTAKLDLQGPLSPDVLGILFKGFEPRTLGRFSFTRVEWDGVMVVVGATGYTGEKGYELFLPVQSAEKLWDALLSYGEVKPIGLGARDSLRLEMGYSLYGHDIDEEHTPLEAGLARFVDMQKDFIGRERLMDQERQGFDRVLTGFVCEGRRSARDGFLAVSDDREIGRVTSGVFSPCLKRGVGLCYIDKKLAVEDQEIVFTDGRVSIKANIKKPPFIQR